LKSVEPGRLKKDERRFKMMHHVFKRNVLAAILGMVVALFSLASATMATNRHHRYYVYDHHSTLKGALVGGGGGALVGGLAGGGEGALIGGGAGAGAGYLVQKYRNHRERRHIGHYH
jgi:hypothetical protein